MTKPFDPPRCGLGLREEASAARPRRHLLAAVLSATILATVAPALAGQVERVGTNTVPIDIQAPDPTVPCTHRLAGTIEKGDAAKIVAAIPSDPVFRQGAGREKNIVCLDSPGGSFSEALEIARFFRNELVGTKIEAGARCESACALVFLSGYFHAHESGTYRWRVLHPLGRLGFHAPSLSVEGGNYNADTVRKAYGVALETVSGAIFQLIQGGESEDGDAMKVSLLGEMLRTPADSMFHVETVDQAGRWDILVGPLPDTVFASRAAMVRACFNAKAWRRDQYSLPTWRHQEVSHFVSEYAMTETKDQHGNVQVDLVTDEMSGDGCRFAFAPDRPVEPYPSLNHVYDGFQALQPIAFLEPATPLVKLMDPSVLRSGN